MKFLWILIFLISCTNKKIDFGVVSKLPSISSIFNNRMLVLLKGTYATDSPLEFSDYNNGTGKIYLDDNGTLTTTLTKDPTFDSSAKNLKVSDLDMYFDFGEIRISSKYIKGAGDLIQVRDSISSQNFWDKIAPNRQVYCSKAYDIKQNTCSSQLGFLKMEQFFNGDGASYPSSDPTTGTDNNNPLRTSLPSQYYYTGLYVRSLFFSYAKEGREGQTGTQIINQKFDNRTVQGINIVPRNNQFPNSTTTEKSYSHPKMFPLLYSIKEGHKDMQIRPGFEPYILEVRMNLKENLMIHSFEKPQLLTNSRIIQTLVGFSDWNKEHKGQSDMGGNVLLRSRVIYPAFASKLNISGGTKSLLHYYTIYRDGETKKDRETELPYAAVPVKSGVSTIKYIHDGNFILQCKKDEKADGYPEKVIREIKFSVPRYFSRKTVNINLTCP